MPTFSGGLRGICLFFLFPLQFFHHSSTSRRPPSVFFKCPPWPILSVGPAPQGCQMVFVASFAATLMLLQTLWFGCVETGVYKSYSIIIQLYYVSKKYIPNLYRKLLYQMLLLLGYTVCPGSSDPFYIVSNLLHKMGHYFLEWCQNDPYFIK